MSLFQGNFVDGVVANHVFYTDNKEFEAIGLNSFNIYSCRNIWNKNLAIIQYFKTTATEMPVGYTIFDAGYICTSAPTGVFDYYDKNQEKIITVSKSYSDWAAIVTYYEKKFSNDPLLTNDIVKNETIKKAKTSLNGGVKFTFPLSDLYSSASGDVNFFLKFLDKKMSGDSDNDIRTVGLPSNMPMVAIPETIAGNQYSYNDILDKNKVGQKRSVLQGGRKNPYNTIAAPLDTYFNESTGKLETGTRRTLAILLTDIDPAPLKTINVGPADLNNLTSNDFVDSASDVFTPYVPTTGLAMPVNSQAKNPNLFTPNLIKSCKTDPSASGYKAETLLVTNRFNRPFKKGSTIFLTRIGKEWIPEIQPQDPLAAQLKVGEWSFCKLIADSDNYFKDSSWAESTSKSWSAMAISPAQYEATVRYKFYNNVKTLLANNNRLVRFDFWVPSGKTFLEANSITATDVYTDFYPSQRYLISTVFDQLPEAVGGNESYSYISRTNMTKGEFQGEKKAVEIGMFWGPVFADGYKQLVVDPTPDVSGVYAAAGYLTNPASSLKFSSTPLAGLRVSYNATKPNSTVSSNPAYSPSMNDVPAEMTSYILDPIRIFKNFSYIGSYSLDDTSYGICNVHFPAPYQKTAKANPNKVQFVPLSANFVGFFDPNSNNTYDSYERNFYKTTRDYLNSTFTSVIPSMAGKMFARIASTSITDQNGAWPKTASSISNRSICGFKSNNAAPPGTDKVVSYDCYILKDPIDAPLGYPENLFNDPGLKIGANCVGVICGKTTISKRGGGNINITATSNFGLPTFSTVTGGQFSVSILFDIPLVSFNNLRNSPGRPQYGSYTDEIQSFGTTALAVRIFDAWPENLTVFDPRHFAVLHFNPGYSNTDPLIVKDNRGVYIDQIGSEVDFRVPTWDAVISSSGDIVSNQIKISNGSKIGNSNKGLVAPEGKWKVSTIRRGMLLTRGGFSYPKTQIGVYSEDMALKYDPYYVDVSTGTTSAKTFSGKKYIPGSIFDIRNGLQIVINTVGTNGEISTFSISNDSNGEPLRGEFLHTDFPFEYTVPIPKDSNGNPLNGAESAIIVVNSGTVYSPIKIDLPPKEHVPVTRISSSSQAGKNEVNDEPITTTFSLDPNQTGKYDLFTHFHNDITHSILYHPYYGAVKFQYITMDIA